MSWTTVISIALAVLLAVLFAIKLLLHNKLQSIDGFNGIVKGHDIICDGIIIALGDERAEGKHKRKHKTQEH